MDLNYKLDTLNKRIESINSKLNKIDIENINLKKDENEELKHYKKIVENIHENREKSYIETTNGKIILASGMLFFLYLIIAGNYMGELLSCKLKKIITTHVYFQHLIAFLTLYFMVVMLDSKLQGNKMVYLFFYTAGIYLWFIMTIRMDINIWFLTATLILFVYIISVYKDRLKNEKELSEFDKKIKNSEINSYLIYIILLLTIFGWLVYLAEKRYEYRSTWSTYKFFFGKLECGENNSEMLEKMGLLEKIKLIPKIFI